MAQTVTIAGQQLDKRVLVIGGGAAGAYVLWRWWQQSRAAAENDTTAPAADVATWTTDDAPGGIAVRPPASESNSNPVNDTPTTDAAWSQAAVEYLSTIGYDGARVASALGAYLANQTLTADQASIVRQAHALFGRAPQHPDLPIREAAPAPRPTTPTPSKPAPAPAPKPAPKPTRTYTVVRGDTLSGIARKFHTTVSRLVQINHISNPNRIFAGQKLTIG